MERIVLTDPVHGIARMQVCAAKDVGEEELLSFANRENPSGTTLGWVTVCQGTPAEGGPIACGDDPERIHWLMEC